MSGFRCTAAIALSILSSAGLGADPTPDDATEERVSRGTEFLTPKLSPDGTRLAVLQINDQDGLDLRIVHLDDNRVVAITDHASWVVSWYTWINDDQIAYSVVDWQGRPVYDDQFNLVSLGARTIDKLTSKVKSASYKAARRIGMRRMTMQYLHALPGDARHVLVTAINDTARKRIEKKGTPTRSDLLYHDVFRFDLRSGRLKFVERNTGDIVQWIPDGTGTIRSAIRLDDSFTRHVLFREPGNAAWEVIASSGASAPGITPVGFSADPGVIYVLSDVGRDTTALFEFDVATRSLGRLLFEGPDVDIAGVMLSPDQRSVASVLYHLDRTHFYFLDPEWQQINEDIASLFPNYKTVLKPAASGTALIIAYNDRNPGRYYHYDRTKNTVRELLAVNEDLVEEELDDTHSDRGTGRIGTSRLSDPSACRAG